MVLREKAEGKRTSRQGPLSRGCAAYAASNRQTWKNRFSHAARCRLCTCFSITKNLVAMRPGDTPVSIPNTTVKTRAADGTMPGTAWESRWLPDHDI